MNSWGQCISYRRFGYQSTSDTGMRSEFTRDYDRIIFLSAFRRLQNKTQVFPLPGNVFVHNRLTHSLEVASVGRSLGSIIGKAIVQKFTNEISEDDKIFYQHELSGVISSACLAHDVGNPAFGHSGEKAISYYFESNQNKIINNKLLKEHFNENEWADLINFEGNANALRLLTRQFKGRLDGGQRLMYVTLASIIKYPCSSSQTNRSIAHNKKYGYFQSDVEAFDKIMLEFGLLNADNICHRHPFVYIVEAADDICYTIIDMEDAHRIGILSRDFVEHNFVSLLKDMGDNIPRTKEILEKLKDDNEAIAYLRAKCINGLVHKCAEEFMKFDTDILEGAFNSTLIDEVEKSCPFLKEIQKLSIEKIYNHPSVIEVELAGYNVMSELLAIFMDAVLNERKTALHNKSIQLISAQYNLAYENVSSYEKTMGVLDFVSGMTDGFATELYRKIKGIDIPSHK